MTIINKIIEFLSKLVGTEKNLAKESKFFGVAVKITAAAQESSGPTMILEKSAMTAWLWELGKGHRKYDGLSQRNQATKVWSLDFVEGTRLFPNASEHEKTYAAEEARLKAKGRTIVTKQDDVLIHVSDAVMKDILGEELGNKFLSVDWVAQFPRTRAPALQMWKEEQPLPVVFKSMMQLFNSKKLAHPRNMDGVGFLRGGDFAERFPHLVPSWMNGRIYQMTTRILDANGQIGKCGMVSLPTELFDGIFERINGRAWQEGDVRVLVPLDTIKNNPSAGIVEKHLLIHRMGMWEFGFRKLRMSTSEMLTNPWTQLSKALMIKELNQHAQLLARDLEDEANFRESYGSIDDVEDISDVTGEIMKEEATSIGDWMGANLPLSALKGTLVDLVKSKVRKAFKLNQSWITIPTIGYFDNMADGVMVRMPRLYRISKDAKNQVPAELKHLCVRKGEFITLNLEEMIREKGYLRILRYPVVNGSYQLNLNEIEFVDGTNVIQTHPDLSVFMTEDKDGDYVCIGFDNPIIKFDISAWKELFQEASVQYHGDVNSAYAPGGCLSFLEAKDLPINSKGEKDGLAIHRKIVEDLEVEYPGTKMGSLVLGDAVANGLIGSIQNKINDVWMAQEGIVTDLKKLIELHVYGRELAEATIQSIKHQEVRVPFNMLTLSIFLSRRHGIEKGTLGTLYPERAIRNSRLPDKVTYDEDTEMMRPWPEILKLTGEYYSDLGRLPWGVNPWHIEAVHALEGMNLTWMAKVDKTLESRVVKALRAFIVYDAQEKDYSKRIFNHFKAGVVRSNGQLRMDMFNSTGNHTSESGLVLERMFTKGMSTSVSLTEMRKIHPILPIISLLKSLYIGSTTILSAGYTKAEIRALGMLLSQDPE